MCSRVRWGGRPRLPHLDLDHVTRASLHNLPSCADDWDSVNQSSISCRLCLHFLYITHRLDFVLITFHSIATYDAPSPSWPISAGSMSTAMPIPKRKDHGSSTSRSSWSSSSASSSYSNAIPETLSKAKVQPEADRENHLSPRRPSLLGKVSSAIPKMRHGLLMVLPGDSLARSVYTVINLGHDGPPRLVSILSILAPGGSQDEIPLTSRVGEIGDMRQVVARL